MTCREKARLLLGVRPADDAPEVDYVLDAAEALGYKNPDHMYVYAARRLQILVPWDT